MRKAHWIYKGVALLLTAALLLGLAALGMRLTPQAPAELSPQIQDILPETDQPMPQQSDSEGNYTGQEETEPPETEPPETEPPETEPPETEPPQTEPPQTEPQETEPPVTEPSETEPSETNSSEPEISETEPDQTQPGNDPQPEDSPGGNGDTDEDGPGQTVPEEGPEDDSELRIVTDLHNGEITYNELEGDILPFYAYLINGDGMTLRVKLRNSATPQNGRYLTGDGKNYQALLQRNETNFFTLYIKEGNTTVQEVTYAIRYVAQKADEDNPTVGDNPPAIITNLEGVEQLSNRNFTLTVQATAYTGKNLYSSNIEVKLDGERITQPTGGPRYEYQLYFQDPEIGDIVHHTVTVRAWDDEGNSAFYSYSFDYRFVDTGDEIGTAYIILDATTVGLGIMEEPYTYRIKQNVPASYAIMEMLEEYGYEYSYAGTPNVGFYLRRIHRGGMMDYPDIPENLWSKVLQDGLTLTGQRYADSLGEFDYTQGSGWMYSIGGAVYAGKGLSNYYLSNGDTLYLRFTLAYGKDIGGYTSTGGSFGTLPTYCGKWINGSYIDLHQWSEQAVTLEPTCTEPGEMSCVCSVCGDKQDTVEIPALEHDFQEVSRTEPADGNDGMVVFRCTHCEEEKKETIPWMEEPTLPPETEPPATEPPATEPPATEPPATEPPETEPTVTEPPETEPPATEPPPTEPPATDPPTPDPPQAE